MYEKRQIYHTLYRASYGVVDAKIAFPTTFSGAEKLGRAHCQIHGFEYCGTYTRLAIGRAKIRLLDADAEKSA
jgi:hypothetical protein